MSYEQAMSAAGATVLAFQQFGDYQGTWYARVFYLGETGWVSGSYGSCSGCDAFEGEFGYNEHDQCEEHHYKKRPVSCAACDDAEEAYRRKLADFGRTYLDGVLPAAHYLVGLDEVNRWSSEENAETAKWIRSVDPTAPPKAAA